MAGQLLVSMLGGAIFGLLMRNNPKRLHNLWSKKHAWRVPMPCSDRRHAVVRLCCSSF